jgi:N-acetylglucosamine malate deacetylase 1
MNLIIAPHLDDEVLGCSSILQHEAHVFYCGIEPNHIIPREKRLEEADRVAKFFGFTYEWTTYTNCNSYTVPQFVDVLQEVINRIKPKMIFIPYPSYNQDHQTINTAVNVALRPHDKNHFVEYVFEYEELDCLWGCEPPKINVFSRIDIERKLTGYGMHASQVRGHRSHAMIKTLAELRGAACGQKYAEGFVVKRMMI